MRKILSILLALSLALSLSVPALAASGVEYIDAEYSAGQVTYTTRTASDYTVVTGQITWSGGWYVVSEDITIPDRITVTGAVHLILADGKTLRAEKGITVNSGDSLTIYGQTNGTGALTTGTADSKYAGIGGGGSGKSSGAITINGGVVTATGGDYAAGIGGGYLGSGSDITIHGGTVKATGGMYGAGIGGGGNGVGTVTISGGTVTATGGMYGAGIGGGFYGTGTVTIHGGTVKATGGNFGAGIGGGYTKTGTVTITGGFVAATGGIKLGNFGAGAAIGSGGTYNSTTTGAEVAESNFNNAVVLRQSGSASTMTGTVYGSPTLTTDATVPSGIALTIPAGSILTIDGNATLTNDGTITVEDTLKNNGTLINNGTIHGTVTGSGRIIVGDKIVITEDYGNKNGAASIEHTVAPTYTVTIPPSVTIGGTAATVSASNVRLDYGKQLVVRLSSDSALNVSLAGDILTYTVSASGNIENSSISPGNPVLAVNPENTNATQSTALTFTLSTAAKYAGDYTGTVTFTVSVEPATP